MKKVFFILLFLFIIILMPTIGAIIDKSGGGGPPGSEPITDPVNQKLSGTGVNVKNAQGSVGSNGIQIDHADTINTKGGSFSDAFDTQLGFDGSIQSAGSIASDEAGAKLNDAGNVHSESGKVFADNAGFAENNWGKVSQSNDLTMENNGNIIAKTAGNLETGNFKSTNLNNLDYNHPSKTLTVDSARNIDIAGKTHLTFDEVGKSRFIFDADSNLIRAEITFPRDNKVYSFKNPLTHDSYDVFAGQRFRCQNMQL